MSRGTARWALPAVSFFCAFLLATAWRIEAGRARLGEDRRERLAGLVATRQERVSALERELAGLRDRVRGLGRAQIEGPLAALERDLDRTALLAGTTSVAGPGLTVTLTDSPLASAGEGAASDFLIQDVDMQLVVNELWSAGAEAISVGSQRVIGSTAIRAAGEAILVNFKVLTSPYRIEAVGDPDVLRSRFERSDVARRFRDWVDVYRLGFEVRRASRLVLPAYAGSLRIRFAHPLAK